MKNLVKAASVIAVAVLAAPAYATGVPFNFPTITFPESGPTVTRSCSDISAATDCDGSQG